MLLRTFHLLMVLVCALGSACTQTSMSSGSRKDAGSGNGSGGGRRSDDGTAENKPQDAERPSDGDESVPGYFLNLSEFKIASDGKGLRIRAPKGSITALSPTQEIALFEMGKTNQGYVVEGGVAVDGALLKTVKLNADGELDESLDPLSQGELVIATSFIAEKQVFIIHKSDRATAIAASPSAGAAFRALSYNDFYPVDDAYKFPEKDKDEDFGAGKESDGGGTTDLGGTDLPAEGL